jgi:hypothetical protein
MPNYMEHNLHAFAAAESTKRIKDKQIASTLHMRILQRTLYSCNILHMLPMHVYISFYNE